MIVINKNSVNKVALTLTERVAIPAPFFLFVFITDGDTEDGEIRLVQDNTASEEQQERFDLFLIEENETGIKEGGAINEAIRLSEAQYRYKVYESEIETTDIALTTGKVLEVGFMRVKKGTTGVDDSDSVYTGK